MLDSTNELAPLSEWRNNFYQIKESYQKKSVSFLANLPPEVAVQLSIFDVLSVLHNRYGMEAVQNCLRPDFTQPSPLHSAKSGDWMKQTNMVGVNVRTIHSFFHVVKYALTLPESQDSIHLLPIWEPGVVGSLYGKVSWNINPAFFNYELATVVPALNTVEKQLKAVVNLLHLMGKKVGMDVIPHTDRFSEVTLVYPRFFEWVRRQEAQIVDFSDALSQEVENVIWQFLQRNGTANGASLSLSSNLFFDPNCRILSDAQRFEILFGAVPDTQGRLNRRMQLMQEILYHGLETLPMTMAPPYRGLHINPADFVLDHLGNRWYTYEFNEPQAMSRVFGPLTRYKLFANKENSWELDFDRPNVAAWEYISQKYFECQQQFNLDFMRGDMAHVQPRPTGVPNPVPRFYDPLGYIKKYIQAKGVSYFAFYAETFLAPPNEMGYGDELDHLEAIEAETTLGDLQASAVSSLDFKQKFVEYIELKQKRMFAPCLTMITADKDDPRFDTFYTHANHLRYFVGIFLADMPSYMSLGFETRNKHLMRGKNEEYSKLYVFQIQDDKEVDKVTHGPFLWGQNGQQFALLNEIRTWADTHFAGFQGRKTRWISPLTVDQVYFIWTQEENPTYIFVAFFGEREAFEEEKVQAYISPYFEANLLVSYSDETQDFPCFIYLVNEIKKKGVTRQIQEKKRQPIKKKKKV